MMSWFIRIRCLCLCVSTFGGGLGCHPPTNGVDGSEQDYRVVVPDSSPSCGTQSGEQLSNGSFEEGMGSAYNGGQPPTTIAGAWDGCCNADNQGQNTTWQVTSLMAHCGMQAIALSSNASANDNVLVQSHLIDGGGSKGFTLTGWFLVQSAMAAQIQLDLFDLTGKQILSTSPPLSGATAGWVSLTATGTLPAGASPSVQARVNNTGALTAFVDDISLTLR